MGLAQTLLPKLAETNLPATSFPPFAKKEEAGQLPMGTGSFSIALFWKMILIEPGDGICAPENDLIGKRNFSSLIIAHLPCPLLAKLQRVNSRTARFMAG